MLSPRASRLLVTYTLANGTSPDVTYIDPLVVPGIGNPRTAYSSLKGAATNMDWPQGSGTFPFGIYAYGNQLLTDNLGDDYGVRSWEITAEPGLIPGKLTVASYHNDNTDDSSPDAITDYDLGFSGWATGPLLVNPTDGTTLWRYPRIRFVPINLTYLL